MSEARSQILAHLPRTAVPDVVPVPATIAEDAESGAQLVDRFMHSLVSNGLTGERTAGVGASRLAILARLRQGAGSAVYASRAIDEAVPGLLDAVGMLGIDAIMLETDVQRVDETLTQPKPVGVGIVVAAAAWADSGTVLLAFPTRRCALAYVWPPRTLVLLPASRLFPSSRTWLAHLRQTGQLFDTLRTDFSLVSGRSSTHDIASTAVVGVYGASEIHIFVIEPEESI